MFVPLVSSHHAERVHDGEDDLNVGAPLGEPAGAEHWSLLHEHRGDEHVPQGAHKEDGGGGEVDDGRALHGDLADAVQEQIGEVLLEGDGALGREAAGGREEEEDARDVVALAGEAALGDELPDEAPVEDDAEDDHDRGEEAEAPLVDLALGVVVASEADLWENLPLGNVVVVLGHREGRDEGPEPKHDGEEDELWKMTNKEGFHCRCC